MRYVGGLVKSDVSIVTSKGLVTILLKLRQKFGIFKGTRVAMIEEGTRTVLQPLTREYIRRYAVPSKANHRRLNIYLRAANTIANYEVTGSDYGFAPGGRKHMGRSREVRKPAGASRIAGMQFTTTEAVAMSPCVPPGIVSVRLGLPVISTVSPGSVAPTNICNSM